MPSCANRVRMRRPRYRWALRAQSPTRSCCPCPRQPWRSTRGSRSRTIRLKGFALHMKMYPANQDLRNLCHSVNRGRMHRPRPRWVLRAKALLPLPTAASAKHRREPPPYDLGFRVSPASEGVRVYAIVWIAFACAGHDLAGSCEPRPYCPCPRKPRRSTGGNRPRTI